MKFSLYSKKNVLDEMQEQTLRKIGERGFCLMWGGLLAAMVIQWLTGNADKAIGEWVVFLWPDVFTPLQSASGMACGTAIFLPVWEPMRFILCWRPWRLRCCGAWPMAIGWALRLLVFRQVCSALHCSNSVHIW